MHKLFIITYQLAGAERYLVTAEALNAQDALDAFKGHLSRTEVRNVDIADQGTAQERNHKLTNFRELKPANRNWSI